MMNDIETELSVSVVPSSYMYVSPSSKLWDKFQQLSIGSQGQELTCSTHQSLNMLSAQPASNMYVSGISIVRISSGSQRLLGSCR